MSSTMPEISHSGCKLLLGRRMFVAMASSIIAQFIFMSCIILITNLSITHPLSWLGDTWAIVTCLRMWCYFVVLASVILLQGLICSKNYLTPSPRLESRFARFCGMFTPHCFVVGGLHMAIGVVLVWLHLSLEGGEYGSLTRRCEATSGHCLVEEHYFLLIGGLWTGLHRFTTTNFFGQKPLEFPLLQRSKYVQVKEGIGAVLPSAAMEAVWPALYLPGLYYYLGGYLRGTIVSALFISTEGEPLDRISRLLNLSLFFHSWLYSTLFILTMNTMHLLFQVCLTEWTPFEISHRSAFENESSRNVTLPEALAMDKVPIVQHLGYLDLLTIAQKDKSRRACLFTLSQPGGHPYNWNCIIEKCLALVKGFTAEVNDVSSVKQESVQAAGKPATAAVAAQIYDKGCVNRMRNLVMEQQLTTNEVETTSKDPPGEQFVVGYLINAKNNLVTYLLSKPLVHYFFGKQNDSEVRHALNNAQTIVWAVDAISSLVVSSLKEDPYGIVQKDVASVIESLLGLKQALDKLQKTNLLMRKSHNDEKTIRLALASLRTAVKRSIYRIVYNFRDYIDQLALESTTVDQLHSFIVYKE